MQPKTVNLPVLFTSYFFRENEPHNQALYLERSHLYDQLGNYQESFKDAVIAGMSSPFSLPIYKTYEKLCLKVGRKKLSTRINDYLNMN